MKTHLILLLSLFVSASAHSSKRCYATVQHTDDKVYEIRFDDNENENPVESCRRESANDKIRERSVKLYSVEFSSGFADRVVVGQTTVRFRPSEVPWRTYFSGFIYHFFNGKVVSVTR